MRGKMRKGRGISSIESIVVRYRYYRVWQVIDTFPITNTWCCYYTPTSKARHTPWLRHVNYVVVFYRSYGVSHTLATATT